MKAQVYRAPEKVNLSEIRNKVKIFLAGSIDMGRAIEWQTEIEKALADVDVVIFNPRRHDFDKDAEYSSDSPYMVEQIEWELKHLDACDIAVFYFDPTGQAPITMYEMGLVSERVFAMKMGGLVCCPEGFWKKANVDVNAMYYDFNIAKDLPEFISKLKKMIIDKREYGNVLEEIEIDL